jgi:hypothetical protein
VFCKRELAETVKLSIKRAKRKLPKAGVEGNLSEARELLNVAIVMIREIATIDLEHPVGIPRSILSNCLNG